MASSAAGDPGAISPEFAITIANNTEPMKLAIYTKIQFL